MRKLKKGWKFNLKACRIAFRSLMNEKNTQKREYKKK